MKMKKKTENIKKTIKDSRKKQDNIATVAFNTLWRHIRLLAICGTIIHWKT